jgi:hypothetical protein
MSTWLDEAFARSWTSFSRVLFEQYNELVAKTHVSIPNVPPQYALIAMLLLGAFLLLSGAQLIQLSGFGAGFMLGVVFLAQTIGVAITDMIVNHLKLQQHATTVLAVTTVLCGLIGMMFNCITCSLLNSTFDINLQVLSMYLELSIVRYVWSYWR